MQPPKTHFLTFLNIQKTHLWRKKVRPKSWKSHIVRSATFLRRISVILTHVQNPHFRSKWTVKTPSPPPCVNGVHIYLFWLENASFSKLLTWWEDIFWKHLTYVCTLVNNGLAKTNESIFGTWLAGNSFKDIYKNFIPCTVVDIISL